MKKENQLPRNEQYQWEIDFFCYKNKEEKAAIALVAVDSSTQQGVVVYDCQKDMASSFSCLFSLAAEKFKNEAMVVVSDHPLVFKNSSFKRLVSEMGATHKKPITQAESVIYMAASANFILSIQDKNYFDYASNKEQ